MSHCADICNGETCYQDVNVTVPAQDSSVRTNETDIVGFLTINLIKRQLDFFC